jgi:hypothetical protein
MQKVPKNMTKKISFFKNATWVSKKAEFDADFKSVKKVAKKSFEKSYQQKHDGNLHFFTFYSCSSIVLLLVFWEFS